MQTSPFGVPPDTPLEDTYEAFRSGVVARLKNVCSEWTQEDFDTIVDNVTRIAMKYPRYRRDGD